MTRFGSRSFSGAGPERSRRDKNGNLTNDGTNTYAWDARNHLSAISGGATASFVYDAFGRRISKAISATTTQDLYDGLSPVQELDGSNPPNVTANLLTGLGIDQYFSRTDSGGTMSFLRDTLGSTVALTDSTGALNAQYTYEPYGKTTASGPANASSYQYTGRENDRTGLYFYRARYYSATSQRFIAQDPLGFGGAAPNLYSYVKDDPIAVSFAAALVSKDQQNIGIFDAYGLGYAITGTRTAFTWIRCKPQEDSRWLPTAKRLSTSSARPGSARTSTS